MDICFTLQPLHKLPNGSERPIPRRAKRAVNPGRVTANPIRDSFLRPSFGLATAPKSQDRVKGIIA
jgi:hypothetical protein